MFTDFQISALSAAEYCRQHDIKYSQYKDWAKVLARRDAEVQRRTAELQSEHKQRLAAKKEEQQKNSRQEFLRKRARAIAREAKREVGATNVEFAEAYPVDNAEQPAITKAEKQAGLEIVVRDNISVRVQPGCSMDLLASVLSLLEDN